MTPAHDGHGRAMRLATFNILSGRSPADDAVDEDRFAGAVASLDADVLGLQEVDRNQPRSRHADLTAIAAEAMGAPEHRFVAALSGTPGATWTAATGEDQPDAAAYGVALLSRYPVLGWQVVRLPPVPVPVPHRFHGRWRPEWVRDEPRVAVVAEVDSPAGRVHVVTTHLSYLRWWNAHQLRVLLRSLRLLHGPVVLTGDLNMGRDRAEQLTGMRPLVTGLTFPADHPTEQIDHLLVTGDLQAASGGPVELPMSDHRALLADLRPATG
jgi:endonuclease/exonuclease/phosphatase family metal-dependent hydrolase